MDKYTIIKQKEENNKNIKEIKSQSKELNNMIYIITFILFFNAIFNILTFAFTTSIYEVLQEILQKL